MTDTATSTEGESVAGRCSGKNNERQNERQRAETKTESRDAMPGPMSDSSDHRCVAGSVSELVQGGSVLHMAVAQHDLQMVRLLLGRGAQQSCRNEEGLTPLQLAHSVASCDFDIFSELVLTLQVSASSQSN